MSEFDLDLLAAGFSAILGAEVVIRDEVLGAGDLQTVSIHSIFHLTYVPIPLESVPPGELFEIYVKTLTGQRMTLQVTESFTIADVKAALEVKEDIPARNQRLVFGGKPLSEEETVKSAGNPTWWNHLSHSDCARWRTRVCDPKKRTGSQL